MDQSTDLVLELQNQNGTYTQYSLGQIQTGSVWGMSAADVDHNGWKDVVTGSGNAKLVNLGWNGTTVTSTITTLPLNYFVQNITFGDFNNDGWVDLSVCDDDDYDKIYVNNNGTFAATTTLINTEINPGMTYGNDPYDSGNYGSVWTDFDNDGDLDLYICHCRQSTSSSTDQRRRDRLFVNDGSNNYTEAAQAHGFEVTDFKQTWTTSFGDLDNDGDMDVVMTNHGEPSQILENDGAGMFTDVTAGSGFTVNFDAIESQTEDFDNDGFLDILVTGPNWVMYHNNGNGTFTQTPGVFAGSGLLSFGSGDLNHDGKIDVFASYGQVYNNSTNTDDVLYLNTTDNNNHYITFDLTGTVSNQGAIGAKVTIYGPWGVQVREVRAGESYGTSNSMHLHFGLGANTVVDSARIDWPSHLNTNRFTNLAADQYVTVVEGGCAITGNTIPGPYILCTGQTITLTAPAGFASYRWSDGSTNQTLTVSTTGMFNVLVTDGGGCTNLSPSVNVELNPDETPTVTSAGDLTFCQGGSVTLTSTPASSYLWSNSATTQSITVTTSGPYTVTIQGLCAPFTSMVTLVSVLAAPVPVCQGDSSVLPAAITLTATGTAVSWYDMQTGGTLLGTGPTYTTPVISVTTTYWADDASTYGGGIAATGIPAHTGTSRYSGNTTNGIMQFTVLDNCVLVSVKAFTNTAGDRQVQLLNSSSVVIDSTTVNIPVDSVNGTVITLNYALTPGDYSITTNSAYNTVLSGDVSPQLERNNSGVAYPYTINNVMSITGSNQGQQYYYYFYDWNVQLPATVCVSARVPVEAKITGTVGIANVADNSTLNVFPNPANDKMTLSFTLLGITTATVEFADAIGKVVSTTVLKDGAGNYKHSFDLNNFAKGVYTIHVSADDASYYQKLVIE
jgi:hypothetical protein